MRGNRRDGAPKSFEARLCAYWAEHPNAVMTLERICIDFSVHPAYAYKVLRRMRFAGAAASAQVWLPARTRTPEPQELEVHA